MPQQWRHPRWRYDARHDSVRRVGERDVIREEADVRRLFGHLAPCPHEMLGFAYLDRDWRLIGLRHCVSTNPLAVGIPLRAVARDAIRLGAVRVAMAHNHPSGDPQPSQSDLTATKRLATGLAALGVALVEHVILTRSHGAFSLRGAGLI